MNTINLKNITKHTDPWPLWEIDDVFDAETLTSLDAIPPKAYNKHVVDDKNRWVFRFTKNNCKVSDVVSKLVTTFNTKSMADIFYQHGKEYDIPTLHNSYVRIDLTLDDRGYVLKPHIDREAKIFTMQIFLPDDETTIEAGTEFFDTNLNMVRKLNFKRNSGYFFFPRSNYDKIQWHGMSCPVTSIRKTLLINYMTTDIKPAYCNYVKSMRQGQLEEWWSVK